MLDRPSPGHRVEPRPLISSWRIGGGTHRRRPDVPVVDASVVIDWVVPGTDPTIPSMVARTRLADDEAPLLAPRLLLSEVASALLRGLRRRRWSGVEADEGFEALRRLPVQLLDDVRYLDRAWELARRYDNHPVYDML